MNLYPISVVVVYLSLLIKFRAVISNPTHLAGDVSVNCGSIGTSAANNGKEWIGDIQPKISPLLQIKGSSTTSTVIPKLMSADPVPHKTARISRSQFSYAFQVSPGQKIIRLHFNPTSYKGFKGCKDLFTVEAGPFTLLGNFSASLTADALGVDSFVKEVCLNIQENQQLYIFFSPESSPSLDTCAFINGIEILTVPASLSYFEGGDVGLQLVGEKSLVHFDYNTALEIFHRVEIKQKSVQSSGNSDDMFPKWAIQNANKRNNNTWKLPVDVGFKYLIRVHLSEVGLKIAKTGDNVFEVLINEMIAHTNVDVVKGTDENNIPWYRDYMVMVRGNKKEGKRDLLISFKTYDDLIDAHTLLSGFEIFKLSNSDNSLACPNPLPLARDSPSNTVQTFFSVLCQRNVIATVATAIFSLVCIVVHKLIEIQEANTTKEENKPKPSARAERLCRRFSLHEIRLATKNFSDALLIGRGGFGKVYKGHVDKEQTTVAIKRLESSSKQGAHEFLTEIETLSELRHVNLVSLIGYCTEQGEMILVYEYMPCGTLADHVYKLARKNNTSSSLTWKQRLDICIGAARGIDYLHTGHGVIHRDVKASNILLDEKFIAKVSDFGLAKPENRSELQTHVSTDVKGTFGYLDPNYFRTRKLTRKSDTFAFGVVLLELLCGRPAVDRSAGEHERVLFTWARDKIINGEVDQIVATSLKEEISPNSLKTFVGVAERCLHDEPKKRPTMSQVVSQLELAVEQQETKQPLEIASVSDDNHCPNNDKDDKQLSSVQTGLTTTTKTTSTDVQNLTPPPKEQTNDKVVSSQLPSTGSAPRRKVSLRWPWETFWKRSKPFEKKDFSLSGGTRRSGASLSSDLLRHFSWKELKTATNNFHRDSIIGGMFSNVYKGLIDNGVTTVAIKRLEPWSIDETLTEIRMLSKLRHVHLVSLIGYCDENDKMFLVYNHMARGTLRDHLYDTENPPLKWKQRLQICIDASRGLNYLHTGTKSSIIHRDVKSTNILLDEKWVAKVSDFGLSTVGPTANRWDNMGTEYEFFCEYVDPEYYLLGKLTEKSDVYSFGIVLFEVLCARPTRIHSERYDQRRLEEWAKYCYRKGMIEQIIDPNLDGQIAPRCLRVFVETAIACLKQTGIERPAMSDVVWSLEIAMQMQEAAEHGGGDVAADDDGDSFAALNPSFPSLQYEEPSAR